MTMAASLVVVMGTQRFDGSGIGGADYPVTDLLQMIGRASRPMVDDLGKCVLMCNGPKVSLRSGPERPGTGVVSPIAVSHRMPVGNFVWSTWGDLE